MHPGRALRIVEAGGRRPELSCRLTNGLRRSEIVLKGMSERETVQLCVPMRLTLGQTATEAPPFQTLGGMSMRGIASRPTTGLCFGLRPIGDSAVAPVLMLGHRGPLCRTHLYEMRTNIQAGKVGVNNDAENIIFCVPDVLAIALFNLLPLMLCTLIQELLP
ncbi:hypothetical protein BC835DRAFT_1311113 [Cytidiella melzeri]|nr:hypothetical protein BC835DRAFT_1311113 [Cytidiella melzeri]